MMRFSNAVKYVLIFCSVSGYSETESGKIPFFPKTQNAETIVSRVLYETEAEVFFYRKQCNLFGEKPDIEKAINGWLIYKSVSNDLTAFRQEEEIRKKQQKRTEEKFLKEVSRLQEIYRRKKEPVQKALDARNRQPEDSRKENEISALENRLKELDELCASEIKTEKEKFFPQGELSDSACSPEENARKRVTTKYGLGTGSFDGLKLSLRDIENSVIRTRIVFSEVPEKKILYSFSQEKDSRKPVLREIKADYTGSGTELFLSESNISFRFDTNLFISLVTDENEYKENFTAVSKSLPAQTLSYRIGFREIKGKDLGVGSLRTRKYKFFFPVSFSKKSGEVKRKSYLYNGEIYDFIFPADQKGSPGEYICLIFRRDRTEELKKILRENDGRKEIIKNPDFLSFDSRIPTEIFEEEPGYEISEEIGKNTGNAF